MRPNLLQFFQAILPDTGVFSAITRNKIDYKFKHKIFYSVRDLAKFCATQLDAPHDLYFALASFKEGWHTIMTSDGETSAFRTAENVSQLRSLWLDVDVGPNKSYATTRDALVALRDFMVATHLPAPWIVNSGSGGLHIYWTFDKAVGRQEWQVVANKLRAATIEHGFLVDPARTRDSASILRVPASNNCKLDEPRKVKLLAWGAPSPFSLFESLLSEYKVEVTPSTDVSGILAGLQGIDLSGLATVVPVDEPQYRVRKAEDVIAQCRQLQLQADAPEPVWRGMLATVRHCENGTQYAHKLSAQHPDYNIDTTFEKLDQLEAKNIAPYTCATFRELRPEVCATCPHNGMINSPISVPESRIETVTIDDSGNVEKEVAPTFEAIPHYNSDRFRVNETGCHAYVGSATGGYWTQIYDFPVVPMQRIRDRTPTGDIVVSYIIRRYHSRGYDEFQVGGDVLMGSGINGFLGSVGFLIPERNRKLMAGLLIDLLLGAEDTIAETKLANSLGWDTNHESFLLGNKVYKVGGPVLDVNPKGNASQFSRLTMPTGTLDAWKKIAGVYNKKGLEWAQVVVCSAFASPLMGIGALEKAALMFITGDKGVGKSTVLQVATSVYGNPKELIINKDDTPLARLAKLGILNSITASFDEMTDLSPKEASELCYQITQGRGKDRMAEMGKGLQTNTTFWSCLPIMSANDSMINHLAQHSADATAQMSRVLEVRASDVNSVYTGAEIAENERIVRSMLKNYGTAGAKYIEYVTQNYEKVEELILKVEAMWLKETGLTNNYRFWTFMGVRLIVGAMIANKLGIIEYDIAGIFAYLKRLVKQSRADMQRHEWKPDSVLSDYMNTHIGNQLIVTHAKRPAEMADNQALGSMNDITYAPKSPASGRDLAIRIELDTKTGYLSKRSVKDWCTRNRIPYDRFITSITDQGLLLLESTRVYLGKGTVYRDTGRTECIKLKMPDDLDLDLD